MLINPADNDWDVTATGRNYSYTFGYGKIDAGLFVEAAKTWKLVKPQAWFDSPQIKLPYTEGPVAESPRQVDVSQPDEEHDKPVPVQSGGTLLTADGISSTFQVTKEMLDRENFETLEHVTVRVWIEHARRGDVEVWLESPSGIQSMLAQRRPADFDTTGFNGWKFMSLKHWGEDPIGTWKLTVNDQGKEGRHGRFNAWGLQLWGESIDPSKVAYWSPAEDGELDEEVTGSWNYTTTTKIKPTALLPGDHAVVTGSPDADVTEPAAVPTDDAGAEPEPEPAVDQGILDGVDTLRSHSAWLAGAFLIVLLAALGGGGYYLYRTRQRAKALNLGERGGYAPVGDDVPLGPLRRRAEESKELYDAFGDGPSDSEDEADERTALKYHESFLDDDDEPRASGSGSRAGPSGAQTPEGGAAEADADAPPAYRDSEDNSAPELVGESSASASSWQDAADDIRRE